MKDYRTIYTANMALKIMANKTVTFHFNKHEKTVSYFIYILIAKKNKGAHQFYFI